MDWCLFVRAGQHSRINHNTLIIVPQQPGSAAPPPTPPRPAGRPADRPAVRIGHPRHEMLKIAWTGRQRGRGEAHQFNQHNHYQRMISQS
jgi:hypothetical protein